MDASRGIYLNGPISDRSITNIEYNFVCADGTKITKTSLGNANGGNIPMKGDIIELYDQTKGDINAKVHLFKVVKRIIPIGFKAFDGNVRSNFICIVCKEIVKRKKKSTSSSFGEIIK